MEIKDSHNSSAYPLTNEVTERILYLLALLNSNPSTRREIFERLYVYYKFDENDSNKASIKRSSKMLERDMQFLEALGYEIKKERMKNNQIRYSLVVGSGPYTLVPFSESEVQTLALLHNLFSASNGSIDNCQQINPFASEVLPLLEKITVSLPPVQLQLYQKLAQNSPLHLTMTTATDYWPHRVTINKLQKAINLRQQISFLYRPLYRKQLTIHHKNFDPYYISYQDGHFYLIGYTKTGQKVIECRVDRIDLDSLELENSVVDLERRNPPIEFSYWVDGDMAKGGISQRWLWHRIEREESYINIEGQEKRRVLVRARAYFPWRIIQQLQKYGSKVELIEPEYLRQQMIQEVSKLYRMYHPEKKESR